LVVEAGEHATSLALGFRIFVGVLNLFFSVFDVAGADGLNVLVKRATQNCLYIFDIETCALPPMALGRSTLTLCTHKTVDKILIQLMTI